MITKQLRGPDNNTDGPSFNNAYTEALMDIIEKVGLYDTSHKPIHLQVPTPNDMATEQLVHFNHDANFATTTYTQAIEEILGKSAVNTDISTDKQGYLMTIREFNEMAAESDSFKDRFPLNVEQGGARKSTDSELALSQSGESGG